MTSGLGAFGVLTVSLEKRSGPLSELVQPVSTVSLMDI